MKPMLRIQISEEIGGKQSEEKVVIEVKSRISSKKEGTKEFELYGNKKIATLSDVKLAKMRICEVRIEVIDELTNAIIARKVMKMG